MRIRTLKKTRACLGYGVGGVSVFFLVLPLVWLVSTSVRPLSEMTRTPPEVFPSTITFDAYVELWKVAPFVTYIANSIVISLATAVIALAFSICAAYAFARLRFRGSSILLMLVSWPWQL